MKKRNRIAYLVGEAMRLNAAGAARNTDLKQIADRYMLSTATSGSLRARCIFVGPPTRKFW